MKSTPSLGALGAILRPVLLPGSLLLCAGLPAQKLSFKETHRFQFPYGRTQSLAFSPDERFLACGGSGGDLAIYEISQKRKVLGLGISYSPIRSCAFFSGGTRLALLGHDLSIWSFPEGKLLKRWPADVLLSDEPCVAISSDNKWIAYHHGLDVIVRKVGTWKIVAQTSEFDAPHLRSLRFSPSGDQLILRDSKLWSWQEPGSKLMEVSVAKAGMESISLPWQEATVRGKRLQLGTRFTQLPVKLRSVISSSSDALIAVATQERTLLIFDRKLKQRGLIPVSWFDDSSRLAVGGTGKALAYCSDREPVIVWQEGKGQFTLPGNASRASSVALDPSGRFLAVCAAERVTSIDLSTGQQRDLCEGAAVSSGWKAAEIVMTKGDQVLRFSAETGASYLLGRLKNSGSFFRGSMKLLTSPIKHEMLYSSEDLEEEVFHIWKGSDHERPLKIQGSYLDATWSQDGKNLLLVKEEPSAFQTVWSPIRSSVTVVGMVQGSWIAAAQRASKKLAQVQTGALSPCNKRLTWAGISGAVTYSRQGKEPAQIHAIKNVHLSWLRYLDDDHFLAHDGQVLTLWRAKDLEQLCSANPLSVPQTLKRGKYRHNPLDPMLPGWDPTPIFIHKAILSRDRKRLVLVGIRDVRVFDLLYS